MSGAARIERSVGGERARDSSERKAFAVVGAIGVYGIWVLATFMLEGRTRLLERFDPSGRALYAVVANILVGTVLALVAARANRAAEGLEGSGARAWSRWLAVAITLGIGASVVALAAPTSARDAVVLSNAFTQVLPTSIAEVVVCWMLVGGTARRLTSSAGRIGSTVLAVLVADVAFALYHVAHSPPFDQPRMMLFLALPGLVIGALVYVVRNVWVAIVAQSFFAVIGMVQNIDASAFRHPFVWAYALAALSVAVFAIMLAFAARRRPPLGRGPRPTMSGLRS
jgi:hypothetical protein